LNRRQKCTASALTIAGYFALICAAGPLATASAQKEEVPLNIGSRLELFVDEYLIDTMEGITRKMHSPQRREVCMVFDRPWEGKGSTYVTVFQDDDVCRMYYRGTPLTDFERYHHGEQVTCYAESTDGVHWTKPDLGIVEYDGSMHNNIIFKGALSHDFVPFKDQNPAAPESQRYKGITDVPGELAKLGKVALVSCDGIHWEKMREEPIIAFADSSNYNVDWIAGAFWDTVREEYVCYLRDWVGGPPGKGRRSVRVSTSKDFINWTRPQTVRIQLGDAPKEQLYTHTITPYFRAPHILLGFPMRFVEERMVHPDYPPAYTGISDSALVSSRDRLAFDRSFMESWIRPGLDPDNWLERNIMVAWGGVVQNAADELSVYWVEHYQTRERDCQLRRGTLRLDGFVSVNAPYAGGEFTTKPLTFEGRELVINYSTSAVGSVQVEIQDAEGNAMENFGLEQSPEIYGDETEHVVAWKGGSDVGALAGQTVRLRFVMKDADLYSIRFRP